MDEALCREVGSELFFPDNHGTIAEAKKVCSLCSVSTECLEYALTFTVEGIWAGTTPTQRNKMKGAAYRKLAS
jgi:WhiB family redox-sensing transcriptional regulator